MDTLLLVEDDETLALGIQFSLEREGYHIIRVASINEAKFEMEKRSVSLILLDNQLPDGTGFEFCKSLRQTSDIPIIFLTACDDEVNIVYGLDLGADDYITKPFRVRELVSRIGALLRRSARNTADNHEQTVLEAGPFILSPQKQKLYKNGIEIGLTPNELKLCLALMRRPGQVLSRELILQQLWDLEGEFIDDNTLSVHIRRLREKIEDEPSRPQFILTVRGTGYKWQERGLTG